MLVHVDITDFLPTNSPEDGPVPETSRAALSPASRPLWPDVMSSRDSRRSKRAARKAAAIPSEGLTKRQQEVLALLSRGKTNAQIAEALDLSLNTVRTHVSGILRRLKVASRTEAAIYGRRAQ